MSNQVLRPTAFAGSWYPDNAHFLGKLFDTTPFTPLTGQPVAAVLPHAGYKFSLRATLPFFAAVRGQTKTVVVLSPSHYGTLAPDRLHTGQFTTWATPFGSVPVPQVSLPSTAFTNSSTLMAEEHGLELFAPLARHFLAAGSQFFPVMVPRLSSVAAADSLAQALLEVSQSWGGPDQTLWIASSDFTHYGPRYRYEPYGTGPDEVISAQVSLLDHEVGAGLAAGRDGLDQAWDNYHHFQPTICGFYGSVLLNRLGSLLDWKGQPGDYYTSQDLAGPARDFVTYFSLLFSGQDRA